MKIALQAAAGNYSDKTICRKVTAFEPEPVELALQDEVALCEFFTSRIHSAWRYSGPRKAANTTALLVVPFDFDESPKTFEERVAQFKDYAGVVYTSSSDSDEQPKIRVLLALAQPITDKTAFEPICDWLKAEYPDADEQVFKVSQPLFPCCEFDSGKPTSGYPRFRLAVLTGRPFTFPPEALIVPKSAAPTGKRSVPTGYEVVPEQKDYTNLDRTELTTLLAYYKDHPIKDGRREFELLNLCAKFRQCGYIKEETFSKMCDANRLYVANPFKETGSDLNDKTITELVAHVYEVKHHPAGPEKWPSLKAALGAAKAKPSHAARRGKTTVTPRSELADLAIRKITEGFATNVGKAYAALRLLDQIQHTEDDTTKRKLWVTASDLLLDESIDEKEDQLSWLLFRRRVTLPYCKAKHGKSTLAATDGINAINCGFKVGLISMEESDGDIKKRFLTMGMTAGHTMDRFHIMPYNPTSFNDLKDAIENAVFIHHLDGIYIDSLATYLTNCLGYKGKKRLQSSDNEEAHAALQLLKSEIADPLGIAVALLGHEGKGENRGVRGQSGFEAAVDMMVHLQGRKADKERKLCYEGRWTQPDLWVTFDLGLQRFIEVGPASMGVKSEETKIERAKAWLRELMKTGNGSVPKAEVRSKAAKEDWFSEGTFYRAASQINIDRTGDPWTLPQAADATDLIKKERGSDDQKR